MTKGIIQGFAGATALAGLVMIIAVVANMALQVLGYHGFFN